MADSSRRVIYKLRRFVEKPNNNVWVCSGCGILHVKHKMFFDHPHLKKPEITYCRSCLFRLSIRQRKMAV